MMAEIVSGKSFVFRVIFAPTQSNRNFVSELEATISFKSQRTFRYVLAQYTVLDFIPFYFSLSLCSFSILHPLFSIFLISTCLLSSLLAHLFSFFRLVNDSTLTPPWCVAVRTLGHTFQQGKRTLYPTFSKSR